MMMRRFCCGVVAVVMLLVCAQAMAEYMDVVLADSPILYYRFEASEGGVAKNYGSAGSTYDGTYVDDVYLGSSEAALGSAAWFDGR